MIKILINNTTQNVDVNDVGQTVSASSTLTINPSDYALFAASDDVISLIGAGTLIVNDGSNDLTIAEGVGLIQGSFIKRDFVDSLKDANRLKVDVIGSLGDGRVKASSTDSTANFLDNKLTTGSSKVTKTIINTGNDEELQLDINSSAINTTDLNNNANFITAAQAPVQPSDITDFETSTQLNARDVLNRDRSTHTGTQPASSISDFSASVQLYETNTNLSFNNTTKVLSYINEAGTTTNVDLTQFLDDTNLSYIVSGVLNSSTGIVTFTRDDSTTFTVDFSALNDQAAINTAITTHEVSITNHDDVNTSGASTGDLLYFDGTNWIPKRKTYKKHARSTTALMNQTNNYEPYLNITDTLPASTLYKISWSYTWSINTTGNDFLAQVQVNNSNTILTHRQETKDSAGTGLVVSNTTGGTTNTSTNQRYVTSGFDVINLSSGALNIDLEFVGEFENLEPTIYKATLSIEEWEE